eukprot:2078426-Rhodomonas_salina.1
MQELKTLGIEGMLQPLSERALFAINVTDMGSRHAMHSAETGAIRCAELRWGLHIHRKTAP